MKSYNYKGYEIIPQELKYRNGRTALQFINVEDGFQFCIASVNLPDEDLKENEMAIKDYSENSGILDFLIDNKIVSAPVRWVNSSHVSIPIVIYNGII